MADQQEKSEQMKILLTAENVNFGYSPEKPVLQDFSFELPEGGMTGLIGPNGAGKSTALKILSGYISPVSGKVKLLSRDITEFPNRRRAEILAVVGQNIFTPLPFTVREIVEMGRALRISRFSALSAQDNEIINSVMAEMDVAEFADKMFSELSGGEKQRVKIAASLAQEPEILLLDEPTSQLDMGHSVRLMRHLERLNRERNISILIVSHDIQLIAEYMRSFILLKNGRTIACGNSAKVLTSELLESAYGCRVTLEKCGHGTVRIIPG
jgi:iron complex transport system ATP-binding protein